MFSLKRPFRPLNESSVGILTRKTPRYFSEVSTLPLAGYQQRLFQGLHATTSFHLDVKCNFLSLRFFSTTNNHALLLDGDCETFTTKNHTSAVGATSSTNTNQQTSKDQSVITHGQELFSFSFLVSTLHQFTFPTSISIL